MTAQPTEERRIVYTDEGGGTVATCQCGWLAWDAIESKVIDAARTHSCRKKK